MGKLREQEGNGGEQKNGFSVDSFPQPKPVGNLALDDGTILLQAPTDEELASLRLFPQVIYIPINYSLVASTIEIPHTPEDYERLQSNLHARGRDISVEKYLFDLLVIPSLEARLREDFPETGKSLLVRGTCLKISSGKGPVKSLADILQEGYESPNRHINYTTFDPSVPDDRLNKITAGWLRDHPLSLRVQNPQLLDLFPGLFVYNETELDRVLDESYEHSGDVYTQVVTPNPRLIDKVYVVDIPFVGRY